MDLNNGRDAVKRDLQIACKERDGWKPTTKGKITSYTNYNNRDIGSWHLRKLNVVCAGDSLGESQTRWAINVVLRGRNLFWSNYRYSTMSKV